eukprot:gene10224-8142_t
MHQAESTTEIRPMQQAIYTSIIEILKQARQWRGGRDSSPASQRDFEVLDADDGAGWELLNALLVPRNIVKDDNGLSVNFRQEGPPACFCARGSQVQDDNGIITFMDKKAPHVFALEALKSRSVKLARPVGSYTPSTERVTKQLSSQAKQLPKQARHKAALQELSSHNQGTLGGSAEGTLAKTTKELPDTAKPVYPDTPVPEASTPSRQLHPSTERVTKQLPSQAKQLSKQARRKAALQAKPKTITNANPTLPPHPPPRFVKLARPVGSYTPSTERVTKQLSSQAKQLSKQAKREAAVQAKQAAAQTSQGDDYSDEEDTTARTPRPTLRQALGAKWSEVTARLFGLEDKIKVAVNETETQTIMVTSLRRQYTIKMAVNETETQAMEVTSLRMQDMIEMAVNETETQTMAVTSLRQQVENVLANLKSDFEATTRDSLAALGFLGGSSSDEADDVDTAPQDSSTTSTPVDDVDIAPQGESGSNDRYLLRPSPMNSWVGAALMMLSYNNEGYSFTDSSTTPTPADDVDTAPQGGVKVSSDEMRKVERSLSKIKRQLGSLSDSSGDDEQETSDTLSSSSGSRTLRGLFGMFSRRTRCENKTLSLEPEVEDDAEESQPVTWDEKELVASSLKYSGLSSRLAYDMAMSLTADGGQSSDDRYLQTKNLGALPQTVAELESGQAKVSDGVIKTANQMLAEIQEQLRLENEVDLAVKRTAILESQLRQEKGERMILQQVVAAAEAAKTTAMEINQKALTETLDLREVGLSVGLDSVQVMEREEVVVRRLGGDASEGEGSGEGREDAGAGGGGDRGGGATERGGQNDAGEFLGAVRDGSSGSDAAAADLNAGAFGGGSTALSPGEGEAEARDQESADEGDDEDDEDGKAGSRKVRKSFWDFIKP